MSSLHIQGWNSDRDRSYGLRSRRYVQYSAVLVMSTSLSVLYQVCAEGLVKHGVFFTSVQGVLPWSTLHVIVRTQHFSVWSLQSVVHLPVSGLIFKCFVSGDDLLCNQGSSQRSLSIQVFTEVRSWSLAHSQSALAF